MREREPEYPPEFDEEPSEIQIATTMIVASIDKLNETIGLLYVQEGRSANTVAHAIAKLTERLRPW